MYAYVYMHTHTSRTLIHTYEYVYTNRLDLLCSVTSTTRDHPVIVLAGHVSCDPRAPCWRSLDGLVWPGRKRRLQTCLARSLPARGERCLSSRRTPCLCWALQRGAAPKSCCGWRPACPGRLRLARAAGRAPQCGGATPGRGRHRRATRLGNWRAAPAAAAARIGLLASTTPSTRKTLPAFVARARPPAPAQQERKRRRRKNSGALESTALRIDLGTEIKCSLKVTRQ